MAKRDTVLDIKSANGADVPESLSQKQLDELLELAKGGEEKKADFDKKLTEFTGAEPEPEDTTGKILVQVNESNPKGSGSYIHPETRQVLRRGGKPTWVVEDSWTDQMVRDKFLTEVRK